MRRPRCFRSAAWVLGSGLTFGPALAGEPVTKEGDPAAEIVEQLVQELNKPGVKEAPKVTEPASKSIFDEVEAKSLDAQAKKARQAEVLLAQAQAAEAEGRLAEAIRLAGSARRQAPHNNQIAAYQEQLQAQLAKQGGGTSYSKAKAHLAAGLTQGQQLVRQGRYVEGLDLLEGVVKASALFPTEANVELYRRLALRQMEEVRRQVDTGEIQLDEPAGDEPEPILVATGSAAPTNARRLLRGLEAATPVWYAEMKNRLAVRMSVDYSDKDVREVIKEIAATTGTKIIVDEPVQRGRGWLETRVNLRVGRASAETILDFVCAQGGVEYVLMERGVVITTPSRAARYLRDLPASLRDNWAAARVIFPEMAAELLAAPSLPAPEPGAVDEERTALNVDTPNFLASSEALIGHIQNLIEKK